MLRKPLGQSLVAALVALAAAAACKSNPPGASGGCPDGTETCGNGCIPAAAMCCDEGSATGSSYCTNAAAICSSNDGGACDGAFTGGPADYCCSTNGSFGSNDCPAGQHHCGLLCWPTSHACSPGDATDEGGPGDGAADDASGIDTATFVGANITTTLGSASGMASGCVYAFSVASGSLTLEVVGSAQGDGQVSGNATGTLSMGVTLTTPSPYGVACTQMPYTVNQTSNDVGGTYAALTATTADGAAFNVTSFAGKLVGSTLTGTLTLNITTFDLDGGGSYVTFPPVVLDGYVLTKQ
ncbi:MAG TPA: hypothetical protein VGG39_00080 [Polyangiaceae bacterium]